MNCKVNHMQKRLIYITTGNKEEALRIGRTLVEEKLVACVNIMDGTESIYWWQDKVEQAKEVVLIAKTTENLVEKVIKRTQALHIYDCPCIVVLPIIEGNAGFLAWIEETVEAH